MLAKQTTSGALEISGRKSLVEVAPRPTLWLVHPPQIELDRQVYNQIRGCESYTLDRARPRRPRFRRMASIIVKRITFRHYQ
jgi:hypothetical protein